MVIELIAILEEVTGLKAYPLHTDSTEDCIVYKANVLADDGAKARHRLEIRLITHTIAEAERLKPLINNALVNVGDSIKVENILEGNMNGGGTLYDYGTETVHSLLYFEYLIKSGVQIND